MRRKDRPSFNKLEKLKEIRKKRLVRLLLDVELRGVDHKIYITKDFRADLTVHDGDWISDHIRTAIVKHNYEINKIPKLQVKDFTIQEIKEYEKTFLSDDQ
tara:strand:+ start:1264 stop:1566 length:303 start_codon:yes stop_codon:yes gene_type:complete